MATKDKVLAITCELHIDRLTHAQAQVFERALAAAAKEVFPDRRVRGIWVHKKAPSPPDATESAHYKAGR